MIDVVDRPNRRICVTLLRYKVDNPESFYAQFRLFGWKTEEENFQQDVYVIYKLDNIVYLVDVMSSVYDKVIADQPISNVLWKVIASVYFNQLFFLLESIRTSWSIGDNRNLFLKLKTKLGLYHVELRSKPKDSPEKNTLILLETQQLPDIGKVDSRDEISCLIWSDYNGRRKVCINFQIDTDKVNIVVYRYRNDTYLEDTEMDIKLNEYKKCPAKRVNLSSYIEIFYKRCFVLDETTVHNQNKLRQEWMSSFYLSFSGCTRD